MTISLRMFLSSTTFGLVVAAVYWLTTRENVGTILLGLFGAGFAFVSGYVRVIQPKTRLDGDAQRAPAELAGETIGVFSLESPWPIVLACCTAALLIGIVLHPMLAVFAIVALFVTLWQLVRESV
ncbi:MAG TPA: cytochrome c oxidase subunit 4 [Candidatus Limnocylindrales bacterium]|nr:cytochrome c oxidase subunit 4 [Candidatus Limnocylindrales bacterium]